MKRPFLLLGILALATSCMTLSGSVVNMIFVYAVSVVVLVVWCLIKKTDHKKLIITLVAILLLAVRMISLIIFVEDTNKKLIGREVEITGRITNLLYTEGNVSRYDVKIKDASLSAAEGMKVALTMFDKCEALPGDIVSAKVVFKKSEDEYKSYNLSNGRYFLCIAERFQLKKTGSLTLWRWAYNLRSAVASAVSDNVSGEAGGVIKALVIGDKSGISEELSSNVKSAGVSHMLVVSGMHLGIICGVLMNLLKRRSKRWVTAIAGILLAGFMALICLFHVSILRAGIAYLVMLVGRSVYRRPDGLSSLGFAAFVAVLFTPYIFYNVAFMLSLTATFGVLYPANMILQTIRVSKKGIFWSQVGFAWEIFVISVCAIFCTLPVTVHYFGYVALVAPVTNLLVNLCVTCALILGVLAVCLFFLPFVGGFCSMPFFLIAQKLAEFFINTVNFVGKSGFGVISIPQNKNIYCFLVTIGFILLVRIYCKYNKRKKEEKYLAERQNA